MFSPRHYGVSACLIAGTFVIWVVMLQASDHSVVDRLAKVQRFGFGGMGIAGVTTEGEKDYRAILAAPNAEAAFENVWATGTPAAKCYALAGLHKLNSAKFKPLVDCFNDSVTI
jgi:hypothetical protein